MYNRTLNIIILAAGNGSRMFSALPKVLHTIAGKAMVQYVIDTSIKLGKVNIYLVYGPGGNLLRKQIHCYDIKFNWILQPKQYGTGHAVQQTLAYLNEEGDVLILYGDVPLISLETLQRLLAAKPEGGIGLLTITLDNPDGYGRIIRSNGEVVGIVEQKDTNEQQQQIKEINTGILVAGSKDLKRWLKKLTNYNAQKEFYLTDITAIAWREGRKINTVQPSKHSEIKGVNNKLQLAHLERLFQQEQAELLLLAGIKLSDPNRFDLRGELNYGQDIYIDINVILEGQVTLGNRVIIGAGCILKNAVIGDDVIINPYTIIEDSHIESYSTVGPFAHLRPGSKLGESTHVGNFVEIKQSRLGRKSKVSHLSYLGDAEIGAQVNIGAGTITCNYDGADKHRTIIGDDVFIGSDSQLVAPVIIGNGATVGAGSTITRNVANGEMVISRIRQFTIANWTRPVKKNKNN